MPRGRGSRKGVEIKAPPACRRGDAWSAGAHGVQAVAHQGPGGDAFGDLAVDQEGRRARDIILLLGRVGAVLQLLDAIDIGEAGLDLIGGPAARLKEMVERSEERRVGKECVSPCRYWLSTHL